jgi:very-short-patch-repair endonuclease
MKCEICRSKFVNKGALHRHYTGCKIINENEEEIIELYINGLSINKLSSKFNIGKVSVLNILKKSNVKIRTHSEGVKLAHKLYPDNFKHTKESKEKIREARLKFMSENPEKTAWRQSNLSYPEKIFLEKIKEIGWDKKYLIVRERSVFPYFIDFAFEEQKIAIEIDGSQHNNVDRIKSDLKKDSLLNSLNWVVLRFTANKIKFEIDSCMDIINSFLKEESIHVGVYKYSDIKYTYNKKINSINLDRSTPQRKVERPPYTQLINEVNELGYAGTGRKYGVSDNSIRKWIKYYEKNK